MASILLYVHRVDNTVNEEDEHYLSLIMDDSGVFPNSFGSFEEELQYILDVQKSVFAAGNGKESIPYGQPREPKDLYDTKTGWCYDKSRVIEKALRRAGFQTRHVNLYESNSSIPGKDLLTPGIRSHAFSEVRTQAGWLVVDSLDPWVSLDSNGMPVAMDRVMENARTHDIQWSPDYEPHMNGIFKEPFTFVYGLYSRHGKFYPPYTPIPDVHYGELMANF